MWKVILFQKNYTRTLHHQVFLPTVNQHSDINRDPDKKKFWPSSTMTKYTPPVHLLVLRSSCNVTWQHCASHFWIFKCQFPQIVTLRVRGRELQERFPSRAAPGTPVSADGAFTRRGGVKRQLQALNSCRTFRITRFSFGRNFANFRTNL